MEMYHVIQLTEHVTGITDPSGVTSFLAVGRERAVLVDTGSGFLSLKAQVEKLTQLPLTVILTHGHCDHAGGASLFADVRLNEKDAPVAQGHNDVGMRLEYAKQSSAQNADLTAADFAPPKETPYGLLHDGERFALGGITLEVIAVPGHTLGSVCVLFREDRAILFGDACNVNTLLLGETSTSIGAYRESLMRLKQWEDRYDTVFYSHGPVIGPRTCLDDNIELCQRILAGRDEAIPTEFMGQKAFRAAAIDNQFQRLDGKSGNIVYDKSRI